MWFRKNKIKEQDNKVRLYGRHRQSTNHSVWDGMRFIEQITMIGLPIMLGFIFYMMLDFIGMIWWLKIVIAAGMVLALIGLITLIVNYFTEY